ncbi:MAG: ABC transporter permease [Candidatus Eisenbacteria bacterium]|nr:ABC transporter permease [Candidatus Eisenbacteria bacterium]
MTPIPDIAISVTGGVVHVRGFLRTASAGRLVTALREATMVSEVVTLDLSECTGMETAAAATAFEATLSGPRASVSFPPGRPELREVFEAFRRLAPPATPPPRPGLLRAHLEGVGADVLAAGDVLHGLWRFAGQSARALLTAVRRPGSFRWSLALYHMEHAGVKAVPIVAMLCWLLGTVLGFQAGYQLKTFGAEIFMPDLLGYSITWEIGPLLAAILVAGRSSSAFAAEIGTMRVRQEVDALEVMGFDVYRFLVAPKVIALVLVMPVLILIADFFGLLGGLLIGGWYLNMPAPVYLSRLHLVMLPIDFYWGILKGLVFAVIIATVGCYMGTRVRGGAAEVGQATTAAVVTSVFLVIVADALISLLYIRIRPTVVV